METLENAVAMVRIKPEDNMVVRNLLDEARKLNQYALSRFIDTDEDLKSVTEDLVLINKFKKALVEEQDKYIEPLKAHLEDIRNVFNPMINLIKEAESINKGKMTNFINAQKARAAEAERLNREAARLAQEQAAFSGTGEFTVNTAELIAPPPVRKVSTSSGSMSEVKAPNTWEVENYDLIPKEYWTLDLVKIGKVIRADVAIPGIRIIKNTTMRTTVK